MQKETNKNLIHLNTFGIEAFCDEYYEIENSLELAEIDLSDDFLILGSGSNMVISKRLPQVIHIKTKGIEILEENDKTVKLKVQAGEIWDDFVSFCVDNNYYGTENLSLIPGTVGASPIQNIGAYGAEVKDIIQSVEYFDIETKSFKNIDKKDCFFEYRDSIFKHKLKGKIIVTSVLYILEKNAELNISYGGIKNYFVEQKPTLKAVRKAVIETRNSKLPKPEELGNSGSFFQNAIVKEMKLRDLVVKHENVPYFKAPGGFKIPTAWLIETAGLKGFRHKNAGVYENHALILVNYGGATANDILELADIIENKVFDVFGIKISKEVNIV
ncbi:MAG: UDP-N-acetylmuramate dehydrogenase [Bacteroidales bacterium]|nr:UDP-N-acetylmuramate dehydrogenase [Bacteroidales bacterium]